MTVPDDAGRDAGAVRLEVTLPCDERFRPLMDRLAGKLVACFGYGATEADGVTLALAHATSGVAACAGACACTSMTMTFTSAGGALTIRVRYLVEPSSACAAAGASIARLLATGGDEAPLAAMRRVVSRVEMGEVDGVECCTLVTPLPASASS